MMKDVVNVENFDFVFSLSAGYPGSTEWVQYACDPQNIPLSTGVTSIQVTDILPYVENGQIRGILAGMPGAAEYESLVEAALKEMGVLYAHKWTVVALSSQLPRRPTPSCSRRMFSGPSHAGAGQAPVEWTTRRVTVACSSTGIPPLA